MTDDAALDGAAPSRAAARRRRRQRQRRRQGGAALVVAGLVVVGVGVCGVFTYEVAETKVTKTQHLAKAQQFPLQLSIEPTE